MTRLPILLVFIFSLACSPVRVYRQLPEVKRWETEIQAFEKTDPNASFPDNPVIFAGSSSIRLWTSLAEDMAPYPVIQRGYGGAKLSDFAVYAERIIHPHNCSAIVLFIANDIAGNDSDKTPREVLRLFRYVVKTIRREFPETPVFWIAVTPTESRWKVWPAIQEANMLIRDYCDKSRNLHFIATEKEFLDNAGFPRNDLFLPDLLHLNPEGYEVWSGIIKSELDRVLIR
jgi:hypothetical protein